MLQNVMQNGMWKICIKTCISLGTILKDLASFNELKKLPLKNDDFKLYNLLTRLYNFYSINKIIYINLN